MNVETSKSFKIMLVFISLFTFGVGGLALWLGARTWPTYIDSTGIKLRNGKQFTWGELTKVIPVTVVDGRGRRMTGRLDLEFGKIKARIVPQSLKNGHQVMAEISKYVGQDLYTG